MKRKFNNEDSVANSQPESLTELAPIIKEFVDKLKMLENEEANLKEQKKELIESYTDRLDTKTLKLALRAAAIKEKVERKDTFDTFCEILDREI